MKYHYEELLNMADVKDWDLERQAFFYILANNDDLNCRVLKIYDFDKNSLKFYENETNDSGLFTGEQGFNEMSSTAKRMFKVAIALYNGTQCDLFSSFFDLNQENYTIISKAIEIRFNFLNPQELKNQARKLEEVGKYKMQILELINENRADIKKLNISKICRVLEINRTTFYNYELDKFFKNMIPEQLK